MKCIGNRICRRDHVFRALNYEFNVRQIYLLFERIKEKIKQQASYLNLRFRLGDFIFAVFGYIKYIVAYRFAHSDFIMLIC